MAMLCWSPAAVTYIFGGRLYELGVLGSLGLFAVLLTGMNEMYGENDD